MEKEIVYGGCYCGGIRYKAVGTPKYASICYCKDCRKIAGAQSVAWVTFPVEDFKYIKGEPVSYKSSEKVVRTFCGTCGTSLTYQVEERNTDIDVQSSTLDNPEKYPPRCLVFADEKLSWDVHLDLPESK
jgi:hypothetical protein